MCQSLLILWWTYDKGVIAAEDIHKVPYFLLLGFKSESIHEPPKVVPLAEVYIVNIRAWGEPLILIL